MKSGNGSIKEKIWCGTHTTFSYLALQLKNILLTTLHSYLISIFYETLIQKQYFLYLLRVRENKNESNGDFHFLTNVI